MDKLNGLLDVVQTMRERYDIEHIDVKNYNYSGIKVNLTGDSESSNFLQLWHDIGKGRVETTGCSCHKYVERGTIYDAVTLSTLTPHNAKGEVLHELYTDCSKDA